MIVPKDAATAVEIMCEAVWPLRAAAFSNAAQVLASNTRARLPFSSCVHSRVRLRCCGAGSVMAIGLPLRRGTVKACREAGFNGNQAVVSAAARRCQKTALA